MDEKECLITYKGRCHCRRVQFEVIAPRILECIDCNCSICEMKRNVHFIVPGNKMRMLQGEDVLTTYTFNTHTAKHKFCKFCGVQAFYIPRSNPDGYAITLYCVDYKKADKVNIIEFDGGSTATSWEDNIVSSGIQTRSKET
eukprot:Nk52_evm20s229 gene=Nk52_evmTU20s229